MLAHEQSSELLEEYSRKDLEILHSVQHERERERESDARHCMAVKMKTVQQRPTSHYVEQLIIIPIALI